MTEQEMAEKTVKKMLKHDGFSAWLGIETVEIHPGKAVLRMKIRKEMLNGFNICHGGIPYSLADSALAFASNSDGLISLSLENSITYLSKINEGDVITATCNEVSSSGKIAVYEILVQKSDNTKVAFFKGLVYKTGKEIS
jgi:acyl-CoA thioesterase